MKKIFFIMTISTSIVLSQNILKVFNNKDKEDFKVDSTANVIELADSSTVIIENDILEVDLVVEDEILLVLPIVAKHPYEINNKSCISGLVKSNFNIIDGHNDSIKRRSELGIENPFKKLKNTIIKK